MLILAADTSTQAASVAIADENKLYGEIYTDIKLKHSERLMFLADDLFRNTGIKLSDIDAFAVTDGPGSFTGLRIAMAAVKGFAQPKDLPVIPVSTIECAAYPLRALEGTRVIPIFDAQQKSVYTAFFDHLGHRLSDDCIMTVEELICRIEEAGTGVLFAGDAVFRYRETLSSGIGSVEVNFVSPEQMLPKASSLARMAFDKYEKGLYTSYRDILPRYLRASQAESNYSVKL